MKNFLIVATSALCVLLAVAVPLPGQGVEIVQIPLEGNKVSVIFLCVIDVDLVFRLNDCPFWLSLSRNRNHI